MNKSPTKHLFNIHVRGKKSIQQKIIEIFFFENKVQI
jgi:hypothetical protein